MKLHDKLMSMPAEQVVAELDQMLERTRVSISWWGQRLVTVDGYEETVTINELAEKFLSTHPFSTISLKDRMNYYNLWTRVQGLYTKSDQKLRKMCAYRILVPLSEFRPWCRACMGDPMARIGEWDGSGKEDIFEFSPEEYATLWPQSEPSNKSWGSRGEHWYATKEMVESILQK